MTLFAATLKHVPADVWAAAKWLSLRQRSVWSEVQRAEITHMNINVNRLDLTGFSTEELKMVETLGLKQIGNGNGGG